MLHVIVNGSMYPAEDAVLQINDLAIQRGYGIFDFFKILNGRPIFLEDHLERFYFSAGQMRLEVKFTRDELKLLLWQLLAKNNLNHSGVKMILTGGYADDGYTISSTNLVITQQPLNMYNDFEDNRDKGISLITYQHQRQMPHIKTIDYLMAIWLQPLIKNKQADDVLYCMNGKVSECPRANFFIVTEDGVVATPATDILHGVVRKQILTRFNKEFLFEERDISIEEMYNAREAFVTSSTKNILPVLSVDGKKIGNGKPGATTLRLAGRFSEILNEQEKTYMAMESELIQT